MEKILKEMLEEQKRTNEWLRVISGNSEPRNITLTSEGIFSSEGPSIPKPD